MFLIPLKLKYRNPNCRTLNRNGIDPPGGTLTFNGGRFKSVASNSGKDKKKEATQGMGVRKKAYGPW